MTDGAPAERAGPAGDCIELRGLRVLGVHGLLAEERQRAQPFEVDLDLWLDLSEAARSDDLADTVDYGAVSEAVAAEVSGASSALLEHLALRVARAVVGAVPPRPQQAGDATRAGIQAVTVSIRKLRPPVPVALDTAGVRVHRHRSELG